MSTESVAKRLRVKEEKILDWENGTASPTYRQLEDLSKIYAMPIEIFFYPDPPDIPKSDIKLRALYEEYLQDTPTEILFVMNNAEIMQNNLRELCYGKNPSGKLITHQIFDGSSICDWAEKVREYLSAPLTEQTELKDRFKALKYWIEKLADVGVYIFKENFNNNAYSGFCLNDPEFPIIYLNSQMLPQRQIFTIFHELFHLLKEKSGIDFSDNQDAWNYLAQSTQEIEKTCDMFASEFLVPSGDFRQTIKTKKIDEALNTNRLDDVKDIKDNCLTPLAKRYSVSNDMILRKLIQTGYLSDSDYKKYQSQPDISKKKNKGRPSYYTIQLSHLGEPYVHLVFEKQAEQGFEDHVVAEYLRVETSKIEGISKRLAGGN